MEQQRIPSWGWFVPESEPQSSGLVSFPGFSHPSLPLVLPTQTHTTNVGLATSADQSFPDTDALITRNSTLAIGVRTADCVPVLVYAPDIKAVAAIHAGWKGTVGGIVANAIDRLRQIGGDPQKFHAVIAPCICLNCYEVNDDLVHTFEDAGFGKFVSRTKFSDPLRATEMPRKPHLDLPGVNRQILIDSGVSPANIRDITVCTRHNPPLPSWRRTPGETKRIITWISL